MVYNDHPLINICFGGYFDMMNDIYLLIERGYSNEEISETLGVSIEDVNNVRISCVRTPTKNKFSKTCINVFCKFLERGISDEQLYQLFRLRKKCKKEDFCMLCQKLRKGQIHTDITRLEIYRFKYKWIIIS